MRSVNRFDLPGNSVLAAKLLQIRFVSDQHDFLEFSGILFPEACCFFARTDTAPDHRRQLLRIIALVTFFFMEKPPDVSPSFFVPQFVSFNESFHSEWKITILSVSVIIEFLDPESK